MEEKTLYPYPCSDREYCPSYVMESEHDFNLEKFCKEHCSGCPDCVVLDIPYDVAVDKK